MEPLSLHIAWKSAKLVSASSDTPDDRKSEQKEKLPLELDRGLGGAVIGLWRSEVVPPR